MAEALKLKDEGVRRRGGDGEGGGGGNALASTWDKFGEYPRRWRSFLHDVRVEMRQVTWPTRREVFVTTWVVIVTVAFFAIFFYGVDTASFRIVQWITKLAKH
jgi:preprotein translocase subunit SecE